MSAEQKLVKAWNDLQNAVDELHSENKTVGLWFGDSQIGDLTPDLEIQVEQQ